MKALWLTVLLLLTNAVSQDKPSKQTNTVIFDHVNVLSTESGHVRKNVSVVIHDGRISQVLSKAPHEAGATTIDGSGKFLMPGFADMHVHIFSKRELPMFLVNGITNVRNMWGFPSHLEMRGKVAAGEWVGPEIATAGPLLDGDPPQLRGSEIVRTAEEANRIVDEQAREGYDYIKVYNRLTLVAYRAILDAARTKGIKVIGHIPAAVSVEEALRDGQYSVEHLSNFPRSIATGDASSANWGSDLDSRKVETIAKQVASAKTWITPTILVMDFQYISPTEAKAVIESDGAAHVPPFVRKMWPDLKDVAEGDSTKRDRTRANFRRMLMRLRAHHARFLVGTDSGNPFVMSGYSYPDELERLVASGFSPLEVLRAATVNAALSLGRTDLGEVSVGKTADLVLLGENPSKDIRAIRKIEGVMVKGRWLPIDDLKRSLDVTNGTQPK
ncbi:MAG: amidohydrolase family protein [Acidobacteriia bacterium]|nr:amidohydrolase family protein [Terriglobia bacterium]